MAKYEVIIKSQVNVPVEAEDEDEAMNKVYEMDQADVSEWLFDEYEAVEVIEETV